MMAGNAVSQGLSSSAAIDVANVQAGESPAKALEYAGRSRNKDRIDEVAKDFEAVFLTQMLEHMFEGIESDPLTGGGEAENVYRSLMLDQYGRSISRAGGIGVANQVKQELLRLQEVK